MAAGKTDEVATGLLSLPDARRDDDDVNTGTVEISFVREGNAKGLLPTTLIGRAILEGNALRLETNSVARADRLRRLVERRLGAHVAFRLREHADPMAAPNRSAVRPEKTPDEPLPAEAIALVRKMKAEHPRKWLDEEIPALRGLTPREAARTKGAPREALRLLLAEIEHAEAQQPVELRMDTAALRRELGLE